MFIESAKGMNALAGINLVDRPHIKHTISTSEVDAVSLLVSFLSELVYDTDHNRLAFDQFEIQVEGRTLKVEMGGPPLISYNKTIKAVTYHDLKIPKTTQGFEAEIVFDV